jgi:glycyl-tRNA synthetase alpha subunit
MFWNLVDDLNIFFEKIGSNRIWSCSEKVGAATLSSNTFFNVLKVDVLRKDLFFHFVQPCYRYFEGNKKGSKTMFLQFQVMICNKDITIEKAYDYVNDLLKNSLKIDVPCNVKNDDWATRCQGSYGKNGYEVQLNQVEICQITKFDKYCGLTCKRPIVEITFGIERLFCAINKISDIDEICMSDNVLYKDFYNDINSQLDIEERLLYQSKHKNARIVYSDFCSKFYVWENEVLTNSIYNCKSIFTVYNEYLNLVDEYNRITMKFRNQLKEEESNLLETMLVNRFSKVANCIALRYRLHIREELEKTIA